MNKIRLKTCLFILILCSVTSLYSQIADVDALLIDIPEPPGARSEHPSPVPTVYQFMDALMGGEFDTCLANFDVEAFLAIVFGRQIRGMSSEEYRELYSFQIQAHRNEFRFLAKVMNRVAKGAKITYSDPRYHKKVQSKIVIHLNTNRGKFEFIVYCRFNNDHWIVYDYVLNGQRLSKTFKSALQGVRVNTYISSLRPFYDKIKSFRPIRNRDYDFSILVPSDFQVRENVSPALLASVSAFDGQFLMHVQAANYDEPQNLSQVGKAIKETLMPFSPRLYDQWKSELAGVEIGNVLFHFLKNQKRFYTHMVIIPLGKKLIVINFYHSSLALLKHMTNLRERIMETIALPKIEAAGGVLPGEIPDELSLDGDEFDIGKDSDFEDSGDITLTPADADNLSSTEVSLSDSSNVTDNSFSADSYSTSEISPPTSEEQKDMLTPDSYIDGGNSDYPEPPPPDDDIGYPDDNEIPPPPSDDSYSDDTENNNFDYLDNSSEGTEVSF